MKNGNALRLIGTLAAFGGLVGCGGGSNVASPDAVINGIFKLKSNAVTLDIVDAATGKILNQSVTISLSGGLVGDIADASGAAITSQTFVNGVANLYTNQTGVLGVTVKTAGYLPGSAAVDVYGKVAFGVIKLVKLSTPPTGVTLASGSATVTGNLTDSLVVKAGAATFTAARGSVFSLSNGSQATGGIKFTVAEYDITKAQSSVPGGLYVLNSGSFDPILFAGAATLQVASTKGEEITTFSPAAKLRLAVVGVNPSTGKPYAVGDKLSVVTLGNGASEWSVAGDATVAQDANGLYALVTADAPGSWGVGYFQSANCSKGVTFSFPKLSGLNLDVSMARTGWSYSFPTAGRTEVQVQGIPVGKSVSFNVSFQGQTVSYSSSRTFSCGDNVVVADTIDASTSKAAFKLNAVCEDGTPASSVLTGFPMVLFDAGLLAGAGYSDDNGSISILGLSNAVKYKFVIPLQPLGDVTGTLVADGGAVQVRLPCTKVTGATGASGD